MAGNEHVNQSKIIKRLVIVALVCAILVTSVIVVDISSADHEYDLEEPSFTDNFPNTLYFYNISEGVTGTIFSFIVNIPVYHSGLHHMVPREISLIYWFRDATDGSDLSGFIYDVSDTWLSNATFDIIYHWADHINLHVDDWWTPSRITFRINEGPGAENVSLGSAFELALINTPGDLFNGHEINVHLAMNVTYSRWWSGLRVNPTQQTVEYDFSLPDSGNVTIQSLEYP
ncbi:MAG: hypothetical protein ACFFFK_03465 [Candidatus Thorarchaeota archaeon]